MGTYQYNNNAKKGGHNAKPAKKSNKKLLIIGICAAVIALAIALIVILTSGTGDKTTAENGKAVTAGTETAATNYIAIEIRDYGTITAELYGDVAPITVDNFMTLVRSGFYDGLTFHRVISGFMIQGGDPEGNGFGGPGWTIKGEFSMNGVKNDLKHERGVLSMARSNAPDSAGSQFFIMHEDYPYLDGSYAAFGKVLSGMEIVDAICANTPVGDDGEVKPADQPVILSIREIEKP